MSLARCELPRPDGTPCGRIISTVFPVHACRAEEPGSINGQRDASDDKPAKRKAKRRRKATK